MTEPYTPTHSATVHAVRLKRALAFVQQAIERRNTIPVLGMVRIDFYASTCTATVTGTDLDIELEMEIEITAAAPDDFTLLLPPRPLADFLRACDDSEPVTIAVDADRVVTLTTNTDGCSMTVRELCPPEDWPKFGGDWIHDTAAKRVEIDGGLLHRALTAVVPCISTEETRYYLNGVYVHNKNGLALVATDGHRLALYKTAAPYPLPDCILPAKAAKILLRALGKGNGAAITVEAWQRVSSGEDKQVLDGAARLRFAGDGWVIRSKTIDGTYPDYNRVIPAPDREVKISATISAAALRRLPTLQRYMSQAVKVDANAGRMTTKADQITVSAPVTGHGEPFGLNIKYLRAITYAAGTVKLEGLTKGDPFTVLTDDPALSYTIMRYRVE